MIKHIMSLLLSLVLTVGEISFEVVLLESDLLLTFSFESAF